jgi:UDP-N-acetylglucosamine 4,6-dehydratase
MRSVLITGGTGTFGQAFARKALDIGCERVCIFSRGEHAQAAMRATFGDDPRLRFFIGDVRDRDRLRRAFEGIDLVVAAAALKRVETCEYDPLEVCKTNVGGAANVIEAATDAGVEKVIAISTDKAVHPVNVYGASKFMAEQMFRAANNARGRDGPRFACVRYGNIWNSNGSVVPKWRQILSHAEVVPVSDPECTRYFMRIEEAVDLVLDTAHTMRGGDLRIPTLPAYRLGDLAQAMGARMNVIGLPVYEKRHETMDGRTTSETAPRLTVNELRMALAA